MNNKSNINYMLFLDVKKVWIWHWQLFLTHHPTSDFKQLKVTSIDGHALIKRWNENFLAKIISFIISKAEVRQTVSLIIFETAVGQQRLKLWFLLSGNLRSLHAILGHSIQCNKGNRYKDFWWDKQKKHFFSVIILITHKKYYNHQVLGTIL